MIAFLILQIQLGRLTVTQLPATLQAAVRSVLETAQGDGV